MKISLVVNTFNEAENLKNCLESVKGFADEIIIVDMYSTDGTIEIAKKFNAKIFKHKFSNFVEPARNFALSKATGDWILLLDPDEELQPTLAEKLKQICLLGETDYVDLPRKNIIFNKWIKHSRWWPDRLTRFFKKGSVEIPAKIHSPYLKTGKSLVLEDKEENAIIHHNYQSIGQFIERLNRYTNVQSGELLKDGYDFNWKDLLTKPANEFFSRFFAAEGYKDGLHGLALALLQSFSELTVYLKVWEKKGFKQEEISGTNEIFGKIINEQLFWMGKENKNSFEKIRLKIKAKI